MKFAGTLLLGLCIWNGVRAEIHLRGFLQQNGGYLFSLWDSCEPAKAEWVTIGATFHSCTVLSYDASREAIRLKKGDVVLEAKLGSTPAAFPPRRHAASKVTVLEGRSCCSLHKRVLTEAQGFVAGPEIICELASSEIRLAYMRFFAEFPNPYGWSVSRQRSEFRQTEIMREYCESCQSAFDRRVTELKAANKSR